MALADGQSQDAFLRQIAQALICRYSHHRIEAPTETDAYADGDVLFQPIEIPKVTINDGDSVLLDSVKLINNNDQAHSTDLIFLKSEVDIGDVNAAATLPTSASDDYLATVKYAVADFTDLGSIRVAEKKNLSEVIRSADDSQSIWVAGIARAAITFTITNGFTVIANFRRS